MNKKLSPIFFYHWVMPYKIPANIVTDNQKKSVQMLFTSLLHNFLSSNSKISWLPSFPFPKLVCRFNATFKQLQPASDTTWRTTSTIGTWTRTYGPIRAIHKRFGRQDYLILLNYFQRNPSAVTFERLRKIPTDVSSNTPLRGLKKRGLQCVDAMKKTASQRIAAAQQRDKQDYGRTIQWKPAFIAGDKALMTWTTFTAFSNKDTDAVVISTYNKLARGATRTYIVLRVC